MTLPKARQQWKQGWMSWPRHATVLETYHIQTHVLHIKAYGTTSHPAPSGPHNKEPCCHSCKCAREPMHKYSMEFAFNVQSSVHSLLAQQMLKVVESSGHHAALPASISPAAWGWQAALASLRPIRTEQIHIRCGRHDSILAAVSLTASHHSPGLQIFMHGCQVLAAPQVKAAQHPLLECSRQSPLCFPTLC
jgi:hypothetical protein